MRIIEVQQGSKEWLDLRRTKITATDASIIMQTNPFKSSYQLWEDKLGLKEPENINDAMRRGTELEPIARQILIEESGIDFKPIVATHNMDTWMMASLDGWNELHDVICEIKCPGSKTHEMALNGMMPEYYRTQIYHQLYVTGADRCIYFSYLPECGNPIAMIDVFPDQEKMLEIRLKCWEFYDKHLTAFLPPNEPWKLNKR